MPVPLADDQWSRGNYISPLHASTVAKPVSMENELAPVSLFLYLAHGSRGALHHANVRMVARVL